MIEDSFGLALSSRQTTMIENFHCSAHQDVLADVSGNAVCDYFVLIGIESRPPLHLKDHIIPTVLPTFQMNLVLATYFGNLGEDMIDLSGINIYSPDNEHVI
jgi:hypothetical protein